MQGLKIIRINLIKRIQAQMSKLQIKITGKLSIQTITKQVRPIAMMKLRMSTQAVLKTSLRTNRLPGKH